VASISRCRLNSALTGPDAKYLVKSIRGFMSASSFLT
jgi:hypothetical protein